MNENELIKQLMEAAGEAQKSQMALRSAYRDAADQIHKILTSPEASNLSSGVVGDARAIYTNLMDCALVVEMALAPKSN